MRDLQNVEQQSPLKGLDEWEEFVKARYPEESAAPSNKAFRSTDPDKKHEQFRDYKAEARDSVKQFYRLNHAHQTFEFVLRKKNEYLPNRTRVMSVWDALEFLNTLVDDSDPDTDLTQIQHLLQTSEAIRRDGHPRWFVLAGLIHDVGKVLCLHGEPQWGVVGDTFPVGCAYSDEIVFHEFFKANPDSKNPLYRIPNGVYSQGCGVEKVQLSWGHDEYLYHVVKDYLPEEALYMICYHSCYPIHREGAYQHLMNDHDREIFQWVHAFNPYDLYSKSHEPPNVKALKPYYDDLIAEYFPKEIAW